ncbi:MAG: diguanylate cyclase [Pseudomonadota bacterium]|nr:diguanylate cyclase [Pseudomonadota bacterium]
MTSIGIWVAVLTLHAAGARYGLTQMTFIQSGAIVAVALSVILLHQLYFRTRMCLVVPLAFKTVGTLNLVAQGICGMVLVWFDRFSYLTLILLTMGVPAAPAFLGLNYGFRGTIAVLGLLMPLLIVVYALIPDNSTTTDPKIFLFFLAAWIVNWTIGAIVNGHNIRKKYLILNLFKEQQDNNRTIQEQNQRLDEKTKALEQANARLRYMSMVDGLTGVANRRHFDETLQDEWGRAVRQQAARQPRKSDTKPEMLSLLLIDIDFFKEFNDHYGHLAGDDCLRQVARTLVSSLKRSSDLAARYGGEEFAVLLPGTPPEGALKVAERIRRRIEMLRIPHEASNVSDVVTVSLGMATRFEIKESAPGELIEMADRALYRAKASGRNCCVSADIDSGASDNTTFA